MSIDHENIISKMVQVDGSRIHVCLLVGLIDSFMFLTSLTNNSSLILPSVPPSLADSPIAISKKTTTFPLLIASITYGSGPLSAIVFFEKGDLMIDSEIGDWLLAVD